MKVQALLFTSVILTLPFMTACQNEQAETEAAVKTAVETVKNMDKPAADNPDVIATVNDKQITNSEFQAYVQQKISANPTEMGDPATILNEMINKELLLQAAVAAGLDKRPEVAEQINTSKSNILINSLINDKVSKVDNSDEALKAEYDAQVNSIELKEYKARHILVEDEETAKGIITELNEGKDFETVAKEKSTGPSGPNGGDLGWFQPQTMVPEFAAALEMMEKGSISKEPVQTQFGWHVIKYEDIRDMEAPPFEESKAQIKSILANKAVQTYMTELRDQATIDIKAPEAPPAEAPAATPETASEPATETSAEMPAPVTPDTTQ